MLVQFNLCLVVEKLQHNSALFLCDICMPPVWRERWCNGWDIGLAFKRSLDRLPALCRDLSFTHVCLCHQAVVLWFGTGQRAVMLSGWESNIPLHWPLYKLNSIPIYTCSMAYDRVTSTPFTFRKGRHFCLTLPSPILVVIVCRCCTGFIAFSVHCTSCILRFAA